MYKGCLLISCREKHTLFPVVDNLLTDPASGCFTIYLPLHLQAYQPGVYCYQTKTTSHE